MNPFARLARLFSPKPAARGTPAAWSPAITPPTVVEAAWPDTDDLLQMWQTARGCLSLRRVFLAAAARGRLCWESLPPGDCRTAVEFLESAADNLDRVTSRADFQALVGSEAFSRLLEVLEAGPREPQAAIIRDVTGDPRRRVRFQPEWYSSAAVGLATAIYTEQTYDRLPILADALQDAGCEDAAVLDHCRGGGPHVRGCWVVDLVLEHD